MGENPCPSYLNSGTFQDCAHFFTSVFRFCLVLSPSTSTRRFPYKSASSAMLFSSSPQSLCPKFSCISLSFSRVSLRICCQGSQGHLWPLVRTISGSAKMSTSSNCLFQREGKVMVAALVLAFLAMLYGPVDGSRFMKSPASPRRTMARLQQTPPPPDAVQFPPPVHQREHRPPPSNVNGSSSPPPPSHPPPSKFPRSPPPPSSSPPPPSHPPPSRFPRSPPPPSSSPPPPPDDQERKLTGGKHSQHGRRLFSSEHVSGPNSSDPALSGRNKFLTGADPSPGKCTDAATGEPPIVTPLVPYGGGYVPVGAPFPYGDPGMLSPVPAPSPTSGADGPSNNQPALAPLGGDNSTMAHTTMVSAMKLNQCTYTLMTSTGNIEGAGTQADVNVEFFDKYGDSVLFVNLRSQNRNFNRGATDTFTVVGDCLQNICKMHLSHDDSGPNPGWFVNTVTVSLMYQTHVFNVFEWLAKDEPPYSLSRIVSSCSV